MRRTVELTDDEAEMVIAALEEYSQVLKRKSTHWRRAAQDRNCISSQSAQARDLADRIRVA